MDKFGAFSLLVLVMLSCGGQQKETLQKPILPVQSEFTVITKVVDSMTVISLEKKGPYDEARKSFSELIGWAISNKVIITGLPFAIYYDDPNRVIPESTRYEVCLPIVQSIKGDKIVRVKKMPATEVASTIYVGTYDKIGPTYVNLMSWLEKNNYIIVGPAREVYLNDPSKVPAESLKTEIQFPIKKKL